MSLLVSKTFKFYRAVSFVRNFTYKAGGSGVNLSAKTLSFHLRKSTETEDYLLLESGETETDLGSKLEITDSAHGKFTVTITDEETSAFDFSGGFWWIGIEDEYGTVKRIFGSTFEVYNP